MTAQEQAAPYGELIPLFRQLNNKKLSSKERKLLRERLVTQHLPLAEHIALRFRNRGQAVEDLRQVAAIGLIHAVDRFEPERGSDFLSFAIPTITGEIRRYFRDATWAMRVPRRLKELHAQISSASQELGQQLGRAPRPSELAAELGIPVDEVQEGLLVSNVYRADSLDTPSALDEGNSSVGDRLGIEDSELTAIDDRMALYPALALLPERERTIVLWRFFGNLTQTQIAERAHISQMHVSRLLSRSLVTLRNTMTAIPAQRFPLAS